MDMISIRRKLMAKTQSGGGRLPAEYQEVEWIANEVGKPYIDTGIIGKSGIIFSGTLLFHNINNNSPHFGSYGNNLRCYLSNIQSGKWSYAYMSNLNSSESVNIDTKYQIETNFSVGNQSLKVNGITVLSSQDTNAFTTNERIYLFGYYYAGGLDARGARFQLYNASIYDNDELVRDFVPCYRKSDNKTGMYDMVSGTFFQNLSTTQEFAIGHKVH